MQEQSRSKSLIFIIRQWGHIVRTRDHSFLVYLKRVAIVKTCSVLKVFVEQSLRDVNGLRLNIMVDDSDVWSVLMLEVMDLLRIDFVPFFFRFFILL